MRRMSFGFFVLLALLTGSFVLAPSGVRAEGPVSFFAGFVVAAPGDPLPTKVRAVGSNDVVCGTADVVAGNEAVGFYELVVVSGAERAGCPNDGGALRFLLLFGSVDAGQVFDADGTLRFRANMAQTQHIWVGPLTSALGWSGSPPPAGGYGLMVWGGPDGARAGQAIALLPGEVNVLYHFDATLKRFLSYVRGGPEFVQTYTVMSAGDIVVVKAR